MPKDSIQVHATASCGFDCIGYGITNLGDTLIISLQNKPGIDISFQD